MEIEGIHGSFHCRDEQREQGAYAGWGKRLISRRRWVEQCWFGYLLKVPIVEFFIQPEQAAGKEILEIESICESF